jgi:uroporphyrinogen III methyltransferase/synthase
MATAPLVSLAGVGPGGPGLITLRAVEAIRRADAIRHPPGIDPGILAHGRATASIEPYKDASEIVELARRGQRIAVLFIGDPLALSDGLPLAERLYQERLPFDVVPGVLSESAGASISGIGVDVVATSLSDPDATRALRVASGAVRSAVARLIEQGHSPDRPAAVIFNPGSPGHRKVVAPLRDIPHATGDVANGDVLLVVGSGVEATTRLDTLVRRPLHGKRVLVTRAREQVEEFHRHLHELGAWVVDIPTIEVRRLELDARRRQALERLDETGLVVFASANAVEIFFEMLFEAGRDARALRDSRLCAIGAETARALEARGLRAELVSGEYTAEGLAAALGAWDLTGTRILVPRSKENRDSLPAILAKRGAEVEILPVYELAPPAAAGVHLRRLFDRAPVDVVTFTSSATAMNFAAAFGRDRIGRALERTLVACMGPVTADAARACGMRVDIIAEEYTTRGLAHAIASHFNS